MLLIQTTRSWSEKQNLSYRSSFSNSSACNSVSWINSKLRLNSLADNCNVKFHRFYYRGHCQADNPEDWRAHRTCIIFHSYSCSLVRCSGLLCSPPTWTSKHHTATCLIPDTALLNATYCQIHTELQEDDQWALLTDFFEMMEIILCALLIPTEHPIAINIKEALGLHGNQTKAC